MTSIVEIAQAIEGSRVGVAIAESTVVFPLIEAVHLLGLAFSVGLLLIVDLRLLGLVLRQVPAEAVMHQLRRLIFVGFALTFASGVLLFWAEAGQAIVNVAFIAHAIFIAIGIANALFFETKWAPRAAEWGDSVRLPAAARFAGAASLSSWALVVISGRLVPYLA
jgi:predicted RND superfamily exporter protein